MDEQPPWPPPRRGQTEHVEPDGSVWTWTGGRWVLTGQDDPRGEDVRLWARSAEVSTELGRASTQTTFAETEGGLLSFTVSEGFGLSELPGDPPEVPGPRDDSDLDRCYQVWWDGSGWWASAGHWTQVDPPGTFADVIELHRRLRDIGELLQPVNLDGVPDAETVARLVELSGGQDRLLRVELRHMLGPVTDHARRLLTAALTGDPVAPPSPEVVARLAERERWFTLTHEQKWEDLLARAPGLAALVEERAAALTADEVWDDRVVIEKAYDLMGGYRTFDEINVVRDRVMARLDPAYDPDAPDDRDEPRI